MLRSGAEVAGVELIDGTNLARGHDSRNERSRNGRREYGRGVAPAPASGSGGAGAGE
jgi:hypothetical protein